MKNNKLITQKDIKKENDIYIILFEYQNLRFEILNRVKKISMNFII